MKRFAVLLTERELIEGSLAIQRALDAGDLLEDEDVEHALENLQRILDERIHELRKAAGE